jgi:hypothetical protein
MEAAGLFKNRLDAARQRDEFLPSNFGDQVFHGVFLTGWAYYFGSVAAISHYVNVLGYGSSMH